MSTRPTKSPEFRMAADEFNRMMRDALSAPLPPDEPKKTTRAPKPITKAKPQIKRK